MQDLKPCPFCIGPVSFHVDPEECMSGCHSILCPNCGMFDLSFAADPENKCETLDALREAIVPFWNRRDEVVAIEKECNKAKVLVLRLKTDFSMMECKKALYNCNWNIDEAEVYLKGSDWKHGKLVTYARE